MNPNAQSLMRAAFGRCPKCGEGHLFRAFLKVADHCEQCGEVFRHHRADDFPAYLVNVIVGHIVVPLALWLEVVYAPPYWVHAAVWIPVTLGLALGLLQPIKGAIVAWQWRSGMHGFAASRP